MNNYPQFFYLKIDRKTLSRLFAVTSTFDIASIQSIINQPVSTLSFKFI